MAAVFALWVASCASLYAQLPPQDALGAILEAFPDGSPVLQGSVVLSALLGGLVLLKVRESSKKKECVQQMLRAYCFCR